MRSSLWQALFPVVLGLAGCSSSAFRGHGDSGQGRLDVLTSFSLAVSKHDYREAARFLPPADRGKLADPDEGIRPEYRERIRAIRRTTMLNNPLIEVRDGLIFGIPDVLPVLELGAAYSLGAPMPADTSLAAAFEVPPVPGEERDSLARTEVKRAAEGFFHAVARKDWKRAMAYVDAQEREAFLDAKGTVKGSIRQRLAAADTAHWDALTLKDGKLTGVVLIMPAVPKPRMN